MKNMEFISFLIYLESDVSSHTSVISDSIHANAAIIRIFSDINPEIGSELHQIGSDSRMTLLMNPISKIKKYLRISFISNKGLELTELLVNALSKRDCIHIGSVNYRVSGIDFDDKDWGKLSSWDEILTFAPQRNLSFKFISPTAINQAGESGRFAYLIPDPTLLFTSIYRKWRLLGGKEFKCGDSISDYIKKGGCYISELNIHTQIEFTPERTQKGFIGYVNYEILGEMKEHARLLTSLTHFSFFTGVGYQTARGMGAVLVSKGQSL